MNGIDQLRSAERFDEPFESREDSTHCLRETTSPCSVANKQFQPRSGTMCRGGICHSLDEYLDGCQCRRGNLCSRTPPGYSLPVASISPTSRANRHLCSLSLADDAGMIWTGMIVIPQRLQRLAAGGQRCAPQRGQ